MASSASAGRKAKGKVALNLALLLLAASAPSATTEQVCASDVKGVMHCSDTSGGESSTAAGVAPSTDEASGGEFRCADRDEQCAERATWTMAAEPSGRLVLGCEKASAYMAQYCPVSCETCHVFHMGYRLSKMLEGGIATIPFCQDNDFNCRAYADMGECSVNPEYMTMFCEASCGICSEKSNEFGVGQRLHQNEPAIAILVKEKLEESVRYMEAIKGDRKYNGVRRDCLNKVPDCTLWAAMGECAKNEVYMKVQCAPACMSCDFLGPTSPDCDSLPENPGPLWKSGDLNELFENIIDNVHGKGEHDQIFDSKALSRPKVRSDGMPAPGVDKDGGPWVALLEHFLTDYEADRLVDIATLQGFEKSPATDGRPGAEVVGSPDAAFCNEPHCREDPVVVRVLERIAGVTRSTPSHGEDLQLLRYEKGVDGRLHSFDERDADLPCGSRIIKVFLYLSDSEEWAGTRFPKIDVTVNPKKGSALLWPIVKDEDLSEEDPRTEHEATTKGVKYAASVWIRNEDFQICVKRMACSS